jgi:hypothetical protein
MPAHNVRANLAASSGTGSSSSGVTFTQTYSTATATHANPTAADLTDNSTGAAGTTIAAGVGESQLVFYINLATLSDADQITTYTVGYKFKILAVDFITHIPVTTGSKASTLNLEIGTTNLTGGVVALTSANCTPRGAIVAGTAVTAANTGSATDTISLEAASTTTFIEGTGWLVIDIQNMDTADAIASLAAQVDAQLVDQANVKQVVNKIIDALQTTEIAD